MTAELIDGKKLAAEITKSVRKSIIEANIQPGLAVILVGDDKPSHLYVSLKKKASQKAGIGFNKYSMDNDVSEADIVKAIEFLNKDPEIDAILVQLPLPEGINEDNVIAAIDPSKDVDGFHPRTIEKFIKGEDDFVPGLSMGIMRLIKSATENLKDKTAVIICNSDIFSRPLEKLLTNEGASVTTLRPEDAASDETKNADIVIIAAGQPELLKADMIKEGSILIDVGTTKVGEQLLGDIDFESVKNKAGYITPVPGGVGPVTVAMLLENTLRLAKRHSQIKNRL